MSFFKLIRSMSNYNLNTLKTMEGFDTVLKKVDVLKWSNGQCIAQLKIEKEHTNVIGGLHGGLSATLIDSLSSMALISHKQTGGVPGVSININLTFLKSVKEGDVIEIAPNILRVGKSMAYITCDITNKANGDLIVRGQQTMFLMKEKAVPDDKLYLKK